MAKLTIEELMANKDKCLERLKIKYTMIGSKFLGGEIEFHSLLKGDLTDVRDRLKSDMEKGVLYFIYMSADDLRNKELLKAYNCDKKENYKIAERLFSEAERARIIEILQELNGLNSVNPDEIYQVMVDDTKN